MVETRIGHKPFFDRGIDSIVGTPDAPDLLQLPGSHELAPVAVAQSTSLDELLAATNLEALLEAAIRPGSFAPGLLSPSRFTAAVESAATHFERIADARRYTNPRVARLLDSAHGLLNEEIKLRELVQFYRNALHQA
ncbi:MAG: hypothetical protein AB7P37_02060 [Ramlibacter sp.]